MEVFRKILIVFNQDYRPTALKIEVIFARRRLFLSAATGPGILQGSSRNYLSRDADLVVFSTQPLN